MRHTIGERGYKNPLDVFLQTDQWRLHLLTILFPPLSLPAFPVTSPASISSILQRPAGSKRLGDSCTLFKDTITWAESEHSLVRKKHPIPAWGLLEGWFFYTPSHCRIKTCCHGCLPVCSMGRNAPRPYSPTQATPHWSDWCEWDWAAFNEQQCCYYQKRSTFHLKSSFFWPWGFSRQDEQKGLNKEDSTKIPVRF